MNRRRIKRFLSALTGAVLALLLMIIPSLAVELTPVRSYDQAGFTDVASDWSYSPIETCYELGLMSDQSPGKFGPNDKVTIAEGVVAAARIRNLWHGGDGSFPSSIPWYQSAVDYAVQNNIMTQGQFSSFTAAITRAQLADLLAQVLPKKDYAPINSVKSLPDVNDKWLHVDCTWDDPISNKPTIRYTYYLIEADTMAKDHVWSQSDYPLPAEYDPAWEQLDPNNITSTDMFRKCLVAQVMQGKTFIRLKTTRSGAYGGIFCIYAYDTGFPYVSGGYNAKTKCYEYTI